jgi:hypothetical protein
MQWPCSGSSFYAVALLGVSISTDEAETIARVEAVKKVIYLHLF